MPSEPASMPMAIKKMRTGTPNLKEVLPAISEMNRSIDPISNIFSVVNIILFQNLFKLKNKHLPAPNVKTSQ
jgi:hypothetical protein